MPIYGYVCDACGHQLEVFQNMSDAPLKECPECGGELRKQLYPVGVVFKGSGFYTTDYKGGGGNGSGSSKSGSGESKSESSSESKSESKPESKTDSKPAASTSD